MVTRSEFNLQHGLVKTAASRLNSELPIPRPSLCYGNITEPPEFVLDECRRLKDEFTNKARTAGIYGDPSIGFHKAG